MGTSTKKMFNKNNNNNNLVFCVWSVVSPLERSVCVCVCWSRRQCQPSSSRSFLASLLPLLLLFLFHELYSVFSFLFSSRKCLSFFSSSFKCEKCCVQSNFEKVSRIFHSLGVRFSISLVSFSLDSSWLSCSCRRILWTRVPVCEPSLKWLMEKFKAFLISKIHESWLVANIKIPRT